MATAAALYSPFQRFVIETHLQFENDYAELQKLAPTEISAKATKKYEEFLKIFQKFLAIHGEYRVQRDEITALTEPYQPTLHKYLCQYLDYVPDLVILTLSYCETDVQREQIERDYKKATTPRRNLDQILRDGPRGVGEALAMVIPAGPLIIAATEGFRSVTSEEIEHHSKKVALTRKIHERTSTVVILKLQALYHNLKAEQRAKTWAARHASLLAPVELSKPEKSDEKKRGGL